MLIDRVDIDLRTISGWHGFYGGNACQAHTVRGGIRGSEDLNVNAVCGRRIDAFAGRTVLANPCGRAVCVREADPSAPSICERCNLFEWGSGSVRLVGDLREADTYGVPARVAAERDVKTVDGLILSGLKMPLPLL